MSKRLAFIAVSAAMVLWVPSASAQSATQLLLGGSGHPLATIDVQGQFTGSLTVTFHGDPATGCAAQGLCAYSGSVTLSPGSGVDLGVERYRQHGHIGYFAELNLGSGNAQPEVAAEVKRTGGGECGDATSPFVALPATIKEGVVSIPLLAPNGTMLSTRCAGPVDGDVSSVAPTIQLPLGEVLKGHRMVDLTGSRSFAAGGFAGTVTSTLKFTLGTPATHPSAPHFPPGLKPRVNRQLTETLAVTQVRGSLGLSILGDLGSCQFLDSCGLHGTVTGTIAPPSATAALTVFGPATRPYADFLAALGLGGHGNPRGLQVFGTIDWDTGGTVTSNLSQTIPCKSQSRLGGGSVLLGVAHGRLVGSYTEASPRTRCPGPTLTPDLALASGSVSLRGVGNRSFTLNLSGSGPLSDDGYAISQRTSLTLTLRRGRLHQTTFRAPGF